MSTPINHASQLVDLDTWQKQTNSKFAFYTKSRSDDLKEIDRCYELHYRAYQAAVQQQGQGAPSDPTVITSGAFLLEALESYVKQKANGDWNKSKRDKETGGQLQALFIYATRYRAMALLANQRAKDAIEQREIPHTRMGVLYLLAHIQVPAFKVTPSLVTGAIKELGTVAVSAASTQYTPKGSKLNSDGEMESFGFLVNDDGTFDTDIKLLNLEELSVDFVELGGQGLDTSGKLGDSLAAPRVRDPRVAKVSRTRRLLNSIASYFMKLWKGIQETWTDIKQPGGLQFYMIKHRSDMEQYATSLIKMILKRLFSKAIPYLEAAMDTAQGFAKTAYYIALQIKNYLNKQHFSITPGHPEVTAQALEDEISGARNGGIKDIIKGAIGLVMSFFAPGLSGLVSAIMSAAEWFYDKISLYREQMALRDILQTARLHYYTARTMEPGLMAADDQGSLHNSGSNAIVNDEERFTQFMRNAVEASPTLAVLTLNSGICGNFMTWIRVIDPQNRMVTAQAVKHANEYFTRLKRFGAKLLRDSEIEILPYGDDPLTQVPSSVQERRKLQHTLDNAPMEDSDRRTYLQARIRDNFTGSDNHFLLGQQQLTTRYIEGILRHAKEGHEGRATVAKFIGGVVMGESIA